MTPVNDINLGGPEQPSLHIDLTPAGPQQAPIVANLLELYAYDFSEFHDIELSADGTFGYRDLPVYWSSHNRHPFLVKVCGKLAGLVLVKWGSEISGNESTWDIAEFFVLRRYRRRGIGTEVAHKVWRTFPGAWEVRVMQSNHSALRFWERAITAFTGKTIQSLLVKKSDQWWHVLSFESLHRRSAQKQGE
jgi:predicted acetyltransferase